jgi:3',5'-cyclic AMP phosphodiesterase CpdA
VLAHAARAGAELSGAVFADADGDGARAAREAPLAGVRVSDGLHVVETDGDGRYALQGDPAARVFVTCPDDFACEPWHRVGGGDFGLRPAPAPDEFFFVQISDAHVFERAQDFRAYSLPFLPRWLPDWLSAQVLLFALDRYYDDHGRGEIVAAFARALDPGGDATARWSSGVLLAYLDEFERPGGRLPRPAEVFRAAIAEIAALAPAFAVSTGDLVLDANEAPPEVAERWLALYRDATRASGLRFHDTIGNNEIVAISHRGTPRSHPDWGKGLYRRVHGPSHYSFDRGRFHFVALDTHSSLARGDGGVEWRNGRMEPEVRAWLERDLALHADRVLVALNHEPFHTSPDWSYYEPADDEGLFAAHGVDFSLAGHVHENAVVARGATLHVTTGALSGMRWIVPAEIHPRGYRLFYARGDRLYSAWKALGEPVLGFVAPPGDPALHAAAAPARVADGRLEVVAVAADAAGPFAAVELLLDGAPLPLERWGAYFLAARVPHEAGARLELRAVAADGRLRRAQLAMPR